MDSKDRRKATAIAGVTGAQAEVVQRYGEAARQHVIAYAGKDSQTNAVFTKGLKDISGSKVNPDYHDTNIKQQAGFSAEAKTVARENAEKIIKGGESTRSTRTDDMLRQADGRGHTIGGKNEQLYDIAEIDKAGIYVEGSARQLKFVGGNPKECTRKLLAKKFDKYRDAEVPLEVPSDFYETVKEDLLMRADKLNEQIERAERMGNSELADKHREQLKKVVKTKESLRKGKVSNDEAIEARLRPKISTAKDMAQISHEAGVKAAKMGVVVGGGMSLVHNTVAAIKGDKSAGSAAVSVVGDTAAAAANGYATNFISTELTSIMGNASSEYLRTLAKTNLPATVVATALNVGRTLARYGRGEIDGADCLAELGETGTGMLASSAGAAVGQVMIPIPLVGALIGSMVGYAMSSACYGELTTLLRDAKLAKEERIRVEAECNDAIKAIRKYRFQIELMTRNYLTENIAVFNSAFTTMEEAYNTGNVDQFVLDANMITKQLGGLPLFETKNQFNMIMSETATIEL